MIMPSMAAINQIGQTSAVNMPVTKKRQPSPIGLRFLYMGKPPITVLYAKQRDFVTRGYLIRNAELEESAEALWVNIIDEEKIWW